MTTFDQFAFDTLFAKSETPAAPVLPKLVVQYTAMVLQPPQGAIRAFGARLIAREFEQGGSGQLPDRVDAQPDEARLDDPACPEGKRLFAAWVTSKGFPFLRAYVDRLGMTAAESIVAMIDGQYAVTATTNGRHSGYLYVCMFEMADGMTPPVVETPIPAPHPSTLPHDYVENTDRYYMGRKNKPCQVCGSAQGYKLHKGAAPARAPRKTTRPVTQPGDRNTFTRRRSSYR